MLLFATFEFYSNTVLPFHAVKGWLESLHVLLLFLLRIAHGTQISPEHQHIVINIRRGWVNF